MVFAVSSQWLAQASSTQITIREANSGRLQCTLRGNGRFRRLSLGTLFLVGEDEDVQNHSATVWDLTRGVAVKTYDTVLSAVASQDKYFLLKIKETDKKMIICEYNASTHTMVRKVKAGKVQQQGQRASLYITADYFIVVQEQSQGSLSWRVLDRTSGSRRSKATTDAISNITVTSRFAFGVVASTKSLLCLELETGKVRPTDAPRVDEQSYQIAESNSDTLFLLIDRTIYMVSIGPKLTATTYCTLLGECGHILHSERLFCMEENTSVKHVYTDLHDLPNQIEASRSEATGISEETNSAKRKMAVLGPGQAGSLSKTDVEPKRAKQSIVTDQDDEQLDQTIAERLQQLEQAMEIHKKESNTQLGNRTSDITTESLVQLVQQGLQSGDRTQLELALKVHDAGTIVATVDELDTLQIGKLMVLLTDRIAAKPYRAEALSVWISPILTRITDVNLLKPLYNLIQDRIAMFPRLMQLQGRLDYFERKSGRTVPRNEQ